MYLQGMKGHTVNILHSAVYSFLAETGFAKSSTSTSLNVEHMLMRIGISRYVYTQIQIQTNLLKNYFLNTCIVHA